jgi:predicted hydrolase (HD superfamily)
MARARIAFASAAGGGMSVPRNATRPPIEGGGALASPTHRRLPALWFTRRVGLTREQAWEQLCTWTETDALRKHARAVEIVMRAAAAKYGAGDVDVEAWGIAGMLHDADYEKWPEDHPNRIVAWLRERGEDAIAHAISAHYTRWNVPYESQLDRALLACDELTGFIGACCLVRPDGVHTLTPKSVKKKLEDKRFAAKVEREEVSAGAELLGVDLGDHMAFIIGALAPHADELGLGGNG